MGGKKAVDILAKELDVSMALSRVSDVKSLDIDSLATIPEEFLHMKSFKN